MTDFSEGEDEVFIRYEDDKNTSNNSDEEEEIDVAAGRRWDPLGEEKENDETVVDQASRHESIDGNNTQIKQLENEQELLSTSLQALTSHFAQVQFRLRQIVESPTGDRDSLLQSLEEFAFRGIPEVMRLNPREHESLYKIMERQQSRQFELIEHLKQQLSDAEKFAYESGADILPQSIVVEKQKAIFNELKNKLKLNVDEKVLPQLTEDDIRAQVDSAIGEFVTPLKMQDTLVSQLKTQIVDLERFVAYLQAEQELTPEIKAAIKNSKNPEIAFQTYNSKMARSRKQSQSDSGKEQKPNKAGTSKSDYIRGQQSRVDHDLTGKMSNLLVKASAILDMFALTQLGCGSQRIQRNSLKKTQKGNHWGDLRAQLEVDVQEVILLVSTVEKLQNESKTIQECDSSETDDYEDDSAENPKSKRRPSKADKEYIATTQAEITALVRKQFAITLQGLMQHGLRDDSKTSTSLMPFIGCMMPFQQQAAAHRHRVDETEDRPNEQMHVWELILEYYHIKNGDQFNDTPARKLSESFNLDIMGLGSQSSSNKHTMLTAIGSIIALHAPYKRSYNSHFKAFISAALNARKLTQWLNLIYQSQELIEQYYTEWSYVAHTGFRDALRTIDRLSHHDFDLPVDLAVRQFQNIKDVFM
ncbi:RUN domain-containing protein 1 isoform X2 [Sitodiplosis mosellana]|uniref:RUN domain-containing protein 1 isoform X2 n=1 Tax=Sitodiplosis mosellana TaxID=263140 RepID=UPI002443F9C1|nr:RUN domain-containing protein 1 isoform X2 [Sitodiplosis mosellana]